MQQLPCFPPTSSGERFTVSNNVLLLLRDLQPLYYVILFSLKRKISLSGYWTVVAVRYYFIYFSSFIKTWGLQIPFVKLSLFTVPQSTIMVDVLLIFDEKVKSHLNFAKQCEQINS